MQGFERSFESEQSRKYTFQIPENNIKLRHKRTAAVGVKSHENFVSNFCVLYVYVKFLGSNMNVIITLTSCQWQRPCFYTIFCMELGQ